MKTLLLTFALFALTLFAPVQEQTLPDGPQHTFQDDLPDKISQWKLTGTIRGQTVEHKVEAQWTLNHQFLQVHEKDAASPPVPNARPQPAPRLYLLKYAGRMSSLL